MWIYEENATLKKNACSINSYNVYIRVTTDGSHYRHTRLWLFSYTQRVQCEKWNESAIVKEHYVYEQYDS